MIQYFNGIYAHGTIIHMVHLYLFHIFQDWQTRKKKAEQMIIKVTGICLLYTSDAADE